MKKYIVFFVLFAVSGCAWMNPYNWWDKQQDSEIEKPAFEPNRFLWQAAQEKLAFLQGVEENKAVGEISSVWTKLDIESAVEFRVDVKILGTNLQSNCLEVKVYRRLRNGKEEYRKVLSKKTEGEIFDKAKVLYRKSINLQ